MRGLGAPEGMRIFLEEAEICLIFVPATVISGMTRAVCPEIMCFFYLHIIRTFENRQSVEDRIDGDITPCCVL